MITVENSTAGALEYEISYDFSKEEVLPLIFF